MFITPGSSNELRRILIWPLVKRYVDYYVDILKARWLRPVFAESYRLYVWIRRKNYQLFVLEMHLLKAWDCTTTDNSHVQGYQHYPTIKAQLLLLSNTVVLVAFLLRKSLLVFLAMTFSIFSLTICFNKVIQKSHCCWILAQVCIAPMLSQSEKISRSLKSEQKSLCQLATTELYSKETKKRVTARKWQERVWVWCLTLMVFRLSNHAEPFFLAWCSLTAPEKSVFKRIKNESKVAMSSRDCRTKHSVH